MSTIIAKPESVQLKPDLAVGHSIIDTYQPGVLVRLTRLSEFTFSVTLAQNVNAFTDRHVGLNATVWLDQFGPAWIIDHLESGHVAIDGRRQSLADAVASAVTGTFARGQRHGLW